jgi:hypothetical protein
MASGLLSLHVNKLNWIELLVGRYWDPMYLLVPGTAAILAYCTNPNDRWWLLEQLVEWKLAGETEVLGENLLQRHFVHHKIPHDRPGLEHPDRSGGKPATNRLSYGAAFFSPISSPLTIRRVTVEVFDPASTGVHLILSYTCIASAVETASLNNNKAILALKEFCTFSIFAKCWSNIHTRPDIPNYGKSVITGTYIL